jgi:hypothetical protein
MAWTESDRAILRHYLGFSALFLQADPRLELAITSVQSKADGGVRPDDSTERLIRGWLAQLARLERRFEELWDEAEALKLDSLGVDPYRALSMLRSEGRRVVGNVARSVTVRPRTSARAQRPPMRQ